MTDHHPSSLIDDLLDPRDTGDTTHLRYMYQARITAALALQLLLPDANWKAILSEHHEDIVAVQLDDKRIGIQVKTKERHLRPFVFSDKGIKTAFKNFRDHERNNPGVYVAFCIFTNHGFCQDKTKKSINYWQEIAESTSDLSELDAFEKATRPREGEEGELSLPQLRAETRKVLRNTRLCAIGPHLGFASTWLAQRIRRVVALYGDFQHVNIEQAASDLTLMASNAMELRQGHENHIGEFISQEHVEHVTRRVVIRNKTIQRHNVADILLNAGKKDWETPPSIVIKHQAYSALEGLLRDNAEDFQTTTVWEFPIDLCSFFKSPSNRESVNFAVERQVQVIEEVTQRCLDRPESRIHYHGIAPIPFIFQAGASIESFTQVQLYERSNKQRWFVLGSGSCDFNEEDIRKNFPAKDDVEGASEAIIRIAISSPVEKGAYQDWFPSPIPTFAIKLPSAKKELITQQRSVLVIRSAFAEALRQIRDVSSIERIHVFAAVPVSVAFSCALVWNPRMDPRMIVYQYSRDETPKYPWGLCIRGGSTSVVWHGESANADG